jgi:uncharacterized protein (TIGR00369 family)
MMEPVNRGIDQRLFAYILDHNNKAPFYVELGVKTRMLGPDCAEMFITAQPQHANQMGIIHGGVISTLADVSMANAVRTTGRLAVTADYTVSFLCPAPMEGELVGRGSVIKAGGKIVFARADILCGDKIVAISQGAFSVIGNIDYGNEQ